MMTHSRNWTKSLVVAITTSLLLVLLRLFTVHTLDLSPLVEAFPSVQISSTQENNLEHQGLERSRSKNLTKIKDSNPVFKILSPLEDTHWSVDTFQSVVWDHSSIPKDSTLDLTFLTDQSDGSLQRIFHKRYIPATTLQTSCRRRQCPQNSSFTLFNLHPEIPPGNYSLVLTAFCRRSATVLGQATIKRIIVVEDVHGFEVEQGQTKGEQEKKREESNKESDYDDKTNRQDDDEKRAGVTKIISRTTWIRSQGKRPMQKFYFRKSLLDIDPEKEPLKLTHESGGKTLVMMAPYTLGWEIPSFSEDTEPEDESIIDSYRIRAKRRVQDHSRKSKNGHYDHNDMRANVVLVTRDQDQEKKLRKGNSGSKEDLETIVHVLTANLDARANFQIVYLPIDKSLLSEEETKEKKESRWRYRIKVEVFGRGRRHVGYTRQFRLKRPAFYQ